METDGIKWKGGHRLLGLQASANRRDKRYKDRGARCPTIWASARQGAQRSPMRKPEAAQLMNWFY